MADNALITTVVGQIKNGFLARMSSYSPAAIVVWLVLAARATKDGICWPSVDSIQADSGLSRSVVCRALRELRDKAEIFDVHGGGRYGSKKYRIRTSSDSELVQKSRLTSSDSELAHYISKPDTRTRRKRGCAAEVVFPSELNSAEFRVAWGRWTAHRREIKKALTPSTIKMQLKKLATMGVNRAVVIIDHTIEKGWTGLYEPSTNGNGQAKKSSEPVKYRG